MLTGKRDINCDNKMGILNPFWNIVKFYFIFFDKFPKNDRG